MLKTTGLFQKYMEACFRHWIKKKANFNFLSHNSEFFLSILWYKLTIVRMLKSELQDINSQMWEKIHNYKFLSHISDFISQDCRFISCSFDFITCNCEFISHSSEKKSHNCEIKSHNYLFFVIQFQKQASINICPKILQNDLIKTLFFRLLEWIILIQRILTGN